MATYFEPTAATVFTSTTQIPVVRPQLAGSAQALPNAGVWTYGAFVTLMAANDVAVPTGLVGLLLWSAQLNLEYQIQLATGAAGVEVGIGEFVLRTSGVDGGQSVHIPIVPSLAIPANARVSFRCASSSGGGATNAKILLVPTPF